MGGWVPKKLISRVVSLAAVHGGVVVIIPEFSAVAACEQCQNYHYSHYTFIISLLFSLFTVPIPQ